jgi:hypothetical protein
LANCTITSVREKAGLDIIHENKALGVSLVPATGDGSNKTFYLPVDGYMCDRNDSETVTTADITVYVNGSSVTVASIDVDMRSVTLSAAPTLAHTVKAIFSWSPVKESTVLAAIARADGAIARKARTDAASSTTTEYFDGDGENKVFYFDYWPVTAISSLSVDGTTTYVDGTDYYLYPSSTRALWLEFETAPTKDNKNITIAYTYGEDSTSLEQLSCLLAAHDILIDLVPRGSPSGLAISTASREGYPSKNRFVEALKAVEKRLPLAWDELGGYTRVTVV